MQKSFRDALEMCQKSVEFDTQGCTLTACSDTEADVRERRKEFGEREVEFNRITGAALSLFGQLSNSAMLKKLPLSFLISQIQSPPSEYPLILPQLEALWHILAL